MMRNSDKFDYQEMSPVHGSLVLASNYGALYKKLYDNAKTKIMPHQFHAILLNFSYVIHGGLRSCLVRFFWSLLSKNDAYRIPRVEYKTGYLHPDQIRKLHGL
jgi:hypothetical protein